MKGMSDHLWSVRFCEKIRMPMGGFTQAISECTLFCRAAIQKLETIEMGDRCTTRYSSLP